MSTARHACGRRPLGPPGADRDLSRTPGARTLGSLAAALALLAGCGPEPPVEPLPVPVRLVVTASDTVTVAGGRLQFSAVALDRDDATVDGGPITWSVTWPNRGQVTSAGVFTAGPAPGPQYVRAQLEDPPLAESVAVRVVPPGTLKWRWAATEIGEAGAQLPTAGGPALGTDGTLYVLVDHAVGTKRATLVALSPRGTRRWAVALDSIETNYPVVTPAGDVLIAGKQVYLVRPTGTVAWQAVMDAAEPIFLSAAVNDNVAFAAHGYNLTALALASGDTLWQAAYSLLSEWVVPPTLVEDDRLYAKHSEDTLFLFRPTDGTILKTFLDPDTALDKAVFGHGTVPVGDRFYLPTVFRLAAFDTAGPLLWLTEDNGRGVNEPAVRPDGVLYVQNGRWGLHAINPDGTTRWYRRHDTSLGYRWWESPRWTWYGGPALAQGGIIYGAGWDRFFAYDTAGTFLWRYMTDSAGVAQPFIGSPTIGPDGTVYTYTATHVYAFWASAPPEPTSPWPMWRHDAQRTGWAR
jgi:outer membrane protein assembly factor BamB